LAILVGKDIKYEDFFGRSLPYNSKKGHQDGARVNFESGTKENSENDDPGSGRASNQEDNEADGSSDIGRKDVPSMNAAHKMNNLDTKDHEEAEERVLSTHERRQLRIAREIEKVEEKLMADKAWQFRGEATAKQRPKDSALEIDLVCICSVLASSHLILSCFLVIARDSSFGITEKQCFCAHRRFFTSLEAQNWARAHKYVAKATLRK
jgi:Mpp10 protein